MKRQNVSSGTPWEPIVGYSRAVRMGGWIAVSGTTATNERGEVTHVGDPYGQTLQTLSNIERALRMAGGSLADVIRTRIYVVDIRQWQDIARAHAEVLGGVRPATSMVEVSRLIHPDMLVEIEADAIVAAAEDA